MPFELTMMTNTGERVLSNMNAFTKSQDGVNRNLYLQTSIMRDPRNNLKNQGTMIVKLSTAVLDQSLGSYEEEVEIAKKEAEAEARKFGGQPSYLAWIYVKPSRQNQEYFYQKFKFS